MTERRQPPLSRQPQRAKTRWKRVLSVALAPILSVSVAIIGWWCMPKPSIPPDIAAVDALPRRPLTKTMASNAENPVGKQVTGAAAGNPAASQAAPPTQNPIPALPQGDKTLVALGDSITFGFNLPGATTSTPSPYAFPYIVGREEHWKVTDLGVPGWETANLLNALQTKPYESALKKANVVTLDIGSNNFLHTTYALLASTQEQLPAKSDVLSDSLYQQALQQYMQTLPEVIRQIRKWTTAQIILLNLYDPFPDGSALHDIGEQVVAAANQVIDQTAALNRLPVVDVYRVVNHHQDTMVRLSDLDIHPTIAGQQAIANAVVDVVNHPQSHQPLLHAVASKWTPVNATTSPGSLVIDWLSPGDGALVVGRNGDWLQVVTATGKTGYVKQDDVSVLLRRYPDVSVTATQLPLQTGMVVDSVTQRSTNVFEWNGVVYAPVAYLAKNADAQVTYHVETREVDINTPQHSGLVQTGLLDPAPVGGPSAAPKAEMHVKMDGTAQPLTLQEQGLEVVVDGEPVNLQSPAVLVNHQVFVPAAAFWAALGGIVKHDTNGLLTLSASGS
ncbi:GDSL-type esterase/lipase family protein [Alicyclobacillus pomorum]|uniref:GDSL-type esterase/lipase family protein n=1 Tax=Alicyclobacillus pomorum TaxID=204470 RepID=UPI0006883F59|nr:GDSL-type esterase/lipase family protein [Alicyclobacillus pomorum]